MNMATMNAAAAGGPVGGGMMMMNNGSPAVPAGMSSTDSSRQSLNTYIYEYLLKHGHFDVARALSRDESFDFKKGSKTSPGNRKTGNEMNGDGGDGMDMDQKDEAPDDIPRPHGWDGSHGNGFLLDWFNIFFDIFQAHTSRGVKGNPATNQYLQYERNQQRMRETSQNQNTNRQGMNVSMMQAARMNGMNGPQGKGMTPQQLIQKRQAMQQQQAAGREQAEGEMNGARPGTPADGEAGGSPSKRPRIDNGQQNFNNGMMQNGRPAGVPGAQNQGGMLMQSGFPAGMNPQFRQNGAMPPKGMQGAMPNGMMNMGNAGSPMMQGINQFPDNVPMDYMNQRTMQGQQPGMQAGAGGQSGNHALQDYQMQLMLLEQQNKKRLMMARQEQHDNQPGAGGPMPGVNMQAAGMSPSGSRTGTSPNPAEAMAGRSPAPMAFMGNMQGGDFNAQMFMGDKGQMQMGPGGPQAMRPPTSADMNAMRAQAGRPNQFQGGQPMQQQGSQAGQQIGTPGQREMPPPQAPAGGSAQRNQGASPSGANAPPTPSQSNRPNPKGNKKGAAAKEDNKRQRQTKKASTANTGNDSENPPATPTPSTPITPNNPGVMNANKGQPGMQAGNQHQPNQGMQMSQSMQPNDMPFNFGDSGSGADTQQFNLDFSTLENADVLENFDFDSFLNTSADDTFNVDIGDDFGAGFGMGQPE